MMIDDYWGQWGDRWPHSFLDPKRYVELTAEPREFRGKDWWPCFSTNLVGIEGGFARLPSGGKRYDNYWPITRYSYARLFHDLKNKYDKNAIAVFYSKDELCEDSILGHIAKYFSPNILNLYEKNYIIKNYGCL